MPARPHSVLLILSDEALKQQLLGHLASRRRAGSLQGSSLYQTSVVASPAQALARMHGSAAPAAIVLEAALLGRNGPASAELENLAMYAPVVLLICSGSAAERFQLETLLALGRLDLVTHEGDFAPLVWALVMRYAARAHWERRHPGTLLQDDFGEVLRHEVNNPLTGILGNAELLLARRDQLQGAVIERLETIAELAVRLRETVRRLSNAWEAQTEHWKAEAEESSLHSATRR